MYEIKLIKNKKYLNVYEYKTKNDCNQTICLQFTEDGTKKHQKYFLCLTIKNKRKELYPYLQITGKDGIKTLIWAKNCIKDFIESIKSKYNPNLKYSILISWDDNRRRDIYYYGLKGLGFYYTNEIHKFLKLDIIK